MTQNVGGIDRILRIVVGLALIVLATGVVGICMPYTLFGFSTCAIKNHPETPAE